MQHTFADFVSIAGKAGTNHFFNGFKSVQSNTEGNQNRTVLSPYHVISG
jgi:hypothetical protein